MKPQDLVIALALARPGDPPDTFADLARVVGLSTSEAHGAVKRLRESGLVDGHRRVQKALLMDFLRYGLRVVFPASPGSLTLGVPTGAAVFPDEPELPDPEAPIWVWPSAQGSVRGMGIEPLYRSLPDAVHQDVWLHEVLAILDLVRAGRAREVRWARTALARRVAGDAAVRASVDPSSPTALRAIFSRQRVVTTAARWRRERQRDWRRPLVEHPLTLPILAAYRTELAEQVTQDVLDGSYSPEPAVHVVEDKAAGARDFVFPCITDTVVARRVVDELESALLGDDPRVFFPRSRASSLGPLGEYQSGRGWRAFVESLPTAADGMSIALKSDVQEFFASIDQAFARQTVAQRTGAHPAVVHLLFSVLESWLPPQYSRRGIPIDPHDVSRLIAQSVLRTVDDEFDDGFDLRYRRFMDDTYMFVEDRDDALRVRERHRKALCQLGLSHNGAKSEILPAEILLARFVDPHRAEISSAWRDPRRFLQVWNEFYLERPTGPIEQMRMRHLYLVGSTVEATQAVPGALCHLREQPVRDSAIRFLETQRLDDAQVAGLLAQYDEASPAVRLSVLGVLGRSRISTAAGVPDWLTSRLRTASAERPAEQAALLLLTYKFVAHRSDQCGFLSEIIAGIRASGSLPRSTASYVLHALESERAVSGVENGSDAAWSRRLLNDLERGAVDVSRVLWVVAGRYRGRPVLVEHLPLMSILGRLARKPACRWRDSFLERARLASETADPVVRQHAARWLADG